VEISVAPEVVRFVNGVILALLPILLAAAIGFVGVKLGAAIRQFRISIGADADAALHEIIRQAVIIAEQSGLAEMLSGEAKKLLATEWVKAELARLGWGEIDVDRIGGLIEYHVYELFSRLKEDWEAADLSQASLLIPEHPDPPSSGSASIRTASGSAS
jgi:hypothetical protein